MEVLAISVSTNGDDLLSEFFLPGGGLFGDLVSLCNGSLDNLIKFLDEFISRSFGLFIFDWVLLDLFLHFVKALVLLLQVQLTTNGKAPEQTSNLGEFIWIVLGSLFDLTDFFEDRYALSDHARLELGLCCKQLSIVIA